MLKIQDTILICPTGGGRRSRRSRRWKSGAPYCEPHVRELADDPRDRRWTRWRRSAPLCDVPPADGAFYCFLRSRTRTSTPMTLAERLIREHKVAVIPGSAFGMTDGCYFRVAYGALQKETVAEGIGRLVTGLRAICG